MPPAVFLLRLLRCPWPRSWAQPSWPLTQAIHVAAKRGNSNAPNALIRNGADLYLKSRVGATRDWHARVLEPASDMLERTRPSGLTQRQAFYMLKCARIMHARPPARKGRCAKNMHCKGIIMVC